MLRGGDGWPAAPSGQAKGGAGGVDRGARGHPVAGSKPRPRPGTTLWAFVGGFLQSGAPPADFSDSGKAVLGKPPQVEGGGSVRRGGGSRTLKLERGARWFFVPSGWVRSLVWDDRDLRAAGGGRKNISHGWWRAPVDVWDLVMVVGGGGGRGGGVGVGGEGTAHPPPRAFSCQGRIPPTGIDFCLVLGGFRGPSGREVVRRAEAKKNVFWVGENVGGGDREGLPRARKPPRVGPLLEHGGTRFARGCSTMVTGAGLCSGLGQGGARADSCSAARGGREPRGKKREPRFLNAPGNKTPREKGRGKHKGRPRHLNLGRGQRRPARRPGADGGGGKIRRAGRLCWAGGNVAGAGGALGHSPAQPVTEKEGRRSRYLGQDNWKGGEHNLLAGSVEDGREGVPQVASFKHSPPPTPPPPPLPPKNRGSQLGLGRKKRGKGRGNPSGEFGRYRGQQHREAPEGGRRRTLE